MVSRNITLYVTEISSFSEFCQLPYYFTKAKAPISPDIEDKLSDGKKAHSEAYNRSFDKSSRINTLNSAILQTLQDNVHRTIREQIILSKVTDRYTLKGRIDEIRIEPTRIVIIDDKNSEEISPALLPMYKVQLELYCYLFYEQFFPLLDIHYELRKIKNDDNEPDKIFLSGKFTPLNYYTWEDAIEKILEWWAGELTLTQTDNAYKCPKCLYIKSACEGVS